MSVAIALSLALSSGIGTEAEPDTAAQLFTDNEPPAAAEPIPAPAARQPDSSKPPARVRASATEGFRLESADGRFGFSLGMLGQLVFSVEQQQPDGPAEPRFALPWARLMFQGNLWGNRVHWQVQPEFSGNTRLLDARAIVRIHPAFQILAGQYRPWLNRGFRINLPLLVLPDRGPVHDTFRVDRDIGVTVFGRPFEGRLEYYLGVMNGEGVFGQFDERNPQPLVTARVVAAPLGAVSYSQTIAAESDEDLPFRFAISANAATNEVTQAQTTTDPTTGEVIPAPSIDVRTVHAGGDVKLQGWRLVAEGEGFWRRGETAAGVQSEAWGAYGHLSIVAVRRRLLPGLRAGVMRAEGEAAAHIPIEPGMAVFFVGNHAKLSLRYRCDLDTAGQGCLSQGGDIAAQLWF
ncbi:MAG: hypothetical protein AAF799_24490 [Myxococcota bacterium]